MARTTTAAERGAARRGEGAAKGRKGRSSLTMRPRAALMKVHRWLSLVVTVWVVIQGLTGAVLVFDDQIHAWSRPELFKRTPGDVGPARVAEITRRTEPNGRLVSVQLPTMQDGVYAGVVSLAPPTQPFGHQRIVYVDPGTGRVNGVRDTEVGFVHWATRLHDSLLQDKVLGVKGETIVFWLGVLAVVILLTGFYVWFFPGLKRWSMFRPRRRSRTALVRQRNLHRMVGVLTFPILLVVFVTGLNLLVPEQGRKVWYAATPGADKGTRNPVPPPQSARPSGGAARPLTLDDARRRAEELTDGRVQSVGLAFGPTGAYSARVTEGWDPVRGPRGRGGNVTIYIDQYTGQQVREIGPPDFPVAAQAYEYWAFSLHVGAAGGFVGRVLWALAGLGLSSLAVSGLAMWALRRRGKARRRAVMREAVPAMPPVLADQAEQKSDLLPVPAGAVVVRQGDAADYFYVVLSGEFDVHEGDEFKRTLGAGTSFGEIGLLQTGVRTATVTAKTDGELLVLPIEQLRRLVEEAERQGVDLHKASAEYAAGVTGRTDDPGPP